MKTTELACTSKIGTSLNSLQEKNRPFADLWIITLNDAILAAATIEVAVPPASTGNLLFARTLRSPLTSRSFPYHVSMKERSEGDFRANLIHSHALSSDYNLTQKALRKSKWEMGLDATLPPVPALIFVENQHHCCSSAPAQSCLPRHSLRNSSLSFGLSNKKRREKVRIVCNLAACFRVRLSRSWSATVSLD